MYDNYRRMTNGFAMNAIAKPPQFPASNLAVGEDELMENIPLLIFREQTPTPAIPVVQTYYEMSHEETAIDGAGDTLSMDNFPTDNFNLGNVYDSFY